MNSWGIPTCSHSNKKSNFLSYDRAAVRGRVSLGSSHSVRLTQFASLGSSHSARLTRFASLGSSHSVRLTRFASLGSSHSVRLTRFASLSSSHSVRLTRFVSLGSPRSVRLTRFASLGSSQSYLILTLVFVSDFADPSPLPDKGEENNWKDVWSEITIGTETAVRLYIKELIAITDAALQSTSWHMKVSAPKHNLNISVYDFIWKVPLLEECVYYN